MGSPLLFEGKVVVFLAATRDFKMVATRQSDAACGAAAMPASAMMARVLISVWLSGCVYLFFFHLASDDQEAAGGHMSMSTRGIESLMRRAGDSEYKIDSTPSFRPSPPTIIGWDPLIIYGAASGILRSTLD